MQILVTLRAEYYQVLQDVVRRVHVDVVCLQLVGRMAYHAGMLVSLQCGLLRRTKLRAVAFLVAIRIHTVAPVRVARPRHPAGMQYAPACP